MAGSSAPACRARRAERARQWEDVFQLGALLGWSPDAVIAFAEALTSRPWRHCGYADLARVLREYRDLIRVIQAKAARRALRSQMTQIGDSHVATE